MKNKSQTATAAGETPRLFHWKEHQNMTNEEEKKPLTAEELRELFRELPDGQMCIVSFGDGEEGGGEDGI